MRIASAIWPRIPEVRRGLGKTMRKQRRITIESESLLVLGPRVPVLAWCPECQQMAEAILLEETAVVSNVALPALQAWLDSGHLHEVQTAHGLTLICLRSLLRHVRNPSE